MKVVRVVASTGARPQHWLRIDSVEYHISKAITLTWIDEKILGPYTHRGQSRLTYVCQSPERDVIKLARVPTIPRFSRDKLQKFPLAGLGGLL